MPSFLTRAIVSFHIISVLLHHIKKFIFTFPATTATTNQYLNIVTSLIYISDTTIANAPCCFINNVATLWLQNTCYENFILLAPLEYKKSTAYNSPKIADLYLNHRLVVGVYDKVISLSKFNRRKLCMLFGD